MAGPAEWDTDEAKALMRYYIERIDEKIDKTDATDFGTDKDAVNGPAVQPLPTVVTNESVGNLG